MSERNQNWMAQTASALIESVQSGSSEQSYIGLLRDMCFVNPKEFVIDCSIANNVLSTVLKKFDSTCQTLVERCRASNTSEDKDLFDLLEVAVASVKSAKALLERVSFGDDVTNEGKLVLFTLGLDLVHSSYAHWKVYKTVYGKHLGKVEDTLGNLSNQTVQLQMVLVQSLENVDFATLHEKQLVSLSNVCEKLRTLAILLQDLDLKMLISARKILVKTLLQYRDCLKRTFNIDAAVVDLCSYVTEWLLKLEKPVKESTFIVEMKAVAFHLRLLDSLLSKYEGFYSSSMKDIVKMIVVLSRMPSLDVHTSGLTAAQRSSLMLHVWIAAEHLVALLATNSDFCTTVLDFDVCENCWCGYLLMLLTILDHIATTSDIWLQPLGKRGIVDLVFDCTDKCILELQCPVSLDYSTGDGKPPRKVGLYETICIHMCRFVAVLLESHFPVLENTLLKNVLCESHWKAFLASDVWCFVARYGTPQLCYEHVQLLVRLVKLTASVHINGHVRLKQLLTRLFHFLADEHKAQLLQSHSDDLLILSILPSSEFTSTLRANVLQLLNKLACKNITSVELKTLVLSTLESLYESEVDFLQILTVLHLPYFGVIPDIPSPQKAEVCGRLSRLFSLVLSSENYVIKHMAMLSFAQFAQVTQHDIVITKAIEWPSLKEAVTSFLMKDDLKKSFFWADFVRKQEKVFSFWTDTAKEFRSDWDSYPCDMVIEAVPEKRRKREDEAEKLVENIEDAVAKLLHADNLGPLQPRLCCLQKQLNDILDKL
ncbi:FIGNL1-interacting regulator of recombination and mitosis-like isoform X2 [Dermacentor variabilis]|uniref:FIGNL1-interacting regulator of recombination and mitosis-like isoform X2 n=1 Tax=Dermacentor variabilis TaxID=34621 RepID=UPI003F5C8A72